MEVIEPYIIKSTNIGDILEYVNDCTVFIIPDNVKLINEEAFSNCTSLEELYLPNSVYFSRNCLEKCHKLAYISDVLPNETLIGLFGTKEKYNNYLKNNREYKLKKIKI